MNKKLSTVLVLATVLTLGIAHTSSFADNKGVSGKEESKKKTVAAPASSWILPSDKTKGSVTVQAGRTLPVKFNLTGSNGVAITSLSNIKISLETFDTCTSTISSKSQIIFDSAVAPVSSTSPAPVMSNSPSASTSASPGMESEEKAAAVLRVDKGIFSWAWKVTRGQASGCYKLSAESGGVIVKSPFLKVKGGK